LVVLLYISVVAEKTKHLKAKGYYKSEEGGTPLAPGLLTTVCYSGQMHCHCSACTACDRASISAPIGSMMIRRTRQLREKRLFMHQILQRGYAVLCCAVLCCAVLCCAVLCCAVLCCAVLCCAVPCYRQSYTMLCQAAPCHARLRHAMLCHAMPCYAMARPGQDRLHHAVLCCAVLCCAMPCRAMPCQALPYHVWHGSVLQVADTIGLNGEYIGQHSRGGGARFAVACILTILMCEERAWTAEEPLGLPSSLAPHGQPHLKHDLR